MNTRNKIILVGVLSFILGIALAQIPDRVGKRDMERGYIRRGGENTMMHDYNNQRGVGMNGMMQGMVANMQGKTGRDLEKAFLTDMIPHHQGAVEMAKLLVADPTVSAEVKAFAQQIITAQEGEIEKMGMWVKNY